MADTLAAPAAPLPFIRRISWAAIIAGLVVALAIELVLSLLGVGIGASTIHVVNGTSASAGSIGIGSGIWFLLSTLIALFGGGWVAGRLAGMPRPIDGTLHGVIAWSLTSLVTVVSTFHRRRWTLQRCNGNAWQRSRGRQLGRCGRRTDGRASPPVRSFRRTALTRAQ